MIGETLLTAQHRSAFGGYCEGGVGLITTALYRLLANIRSRELSAMRSATLPVADLAAAMVFISPVKEHPR
jgi:hypothetical protein